MKTTIQSVPTMTIEAFADRHHLEMMVYERREPSTPSARFYAHFDHAEVKKDGILAGTYGDGATPSKAIADYVPQISLKRLVIDAMKPTRREIDVPRLTP